MASLLFGAPARKLTPDASHLPPSDVYVIALQHGHHFQLGRGGHHWYKGNGKNLTFIWQSDPPVHLGVFVSPGASAFDPA